MKVKEGVNRISVHAKDGEGIIDSRYLVCHGKSLEVIIPSCQQVKS